VSLDENTPDTDLEAHAREILSGQAFSQMLGVELVTIAHGRSELRMPITDSHKQHLGFTHGGAIASLADMALAFAGGPMMGGGAVTQEFKINYLRPGIGEAMIARGQVVGSGRSQAVVRADVMVLADGVEKLCATAQGTIMKPGA
jgi:uncharacterized protein (TIGR00369 family)